MRANEWTQIMSRMPSERHLLLPVEKDCLRGTYREFYKTKRNNFIAMVSHFPSLWQNFQLLDEIWSRGNQDLTKLGEPKQVFPSLLYQQAHLKFRIAMELGFSLLLPEAWAVLRVGIESSAHAHKIHRDPKAAHIWSARDEGKTERAVFNKMFTENKKESLFPSLAGLRKLYSYWKDYSDWGSHCSVVDMGIRVSQVDSPEDDTFRFDCFETNEFRAIWYVYCLLDAGRLMEAVFSDIFRDRLQLDYHLIQQRASFEKRHGDMKGEIKARYGSQIASVLRDVD
ncbi:MAG: hypothetical protein ACYDA9_19695 [Terriglobia bacterium]